MIQVAVGLVVGVACTAIWERLFAEPKMLTAPDNLFVVATVMVMVGTGACAWPAFRATRVDPLAALRQE
jgi:ABC-type antimicrobial peptide transport system permease subunit